MIPLKISTEQMIALHGFFAEAVALGERFLGEISGSETEINVVEIRCSSLGEFGEQGLRLTEDLVASVIGRLEGPMPGTLSLSLEPEDALVWASIGGGDDPLRTFVQLGRQLLEGISLALGEILQSESCFSGAALVEEPELTMLVQTHAPSDTVVFSAQLRIEVRDELLSAMTHLLIEPKYLAQLLSALSAAIH